MRSAIILLFLAGAGILNAISCKKADSTATTSDRQRSVGRYAGIRKRYKQIIPPPNWDSSFQDTVFIWAAANDSVTILNHGWFSNMVPYTFLWDTSQGHYQAGNYDPHSEDQLFFYPLKDSIYCHQQKSGGSAMNGAFLSDDFYGKKL